MLSILDLQSLLRRRATCPSSRSAAAASASPGVWRDLRPPSKGSSFSGKKGLVRNEESLQFGNFNLDSSESWYPDAKQNVLPGLMTETIVAGLRPWTVYHLRLFAENQLGKSKEGKVLQVRQTKRVPLPFSLHQPVALPRAVRDERREAGRAPAQRPPDGHLAHVARVDLGRPGGRAPSRSRRPLQRGLQGVQVSGEHLQRVRILLPLPCQVVSARLWPASFPLSSAPPQSGRRWLRQGG